MQTMFRLLTFMIGAIAGVAAAIFILPIPGKTFFNKMARLPKGSKDLIDDTIDLSISFFKLCLGFASNLTDKVGEALTVAKDRADAVREEFEAKKELESNQELDVCDKENAKVA